MKSLSYTLLSIVLFCLILIYLKGVLVPFVFAVMIYFIVNEVRFYLSKFKILREGFPFWLQNTLAFLVILGFISFLVWFVSNDLDRLSEKWPFYEYSIKKLGGRLSSVLNIDIVASWNDFLHTFKITNVLQGVVGFMSSLLGNIFLVLLYVLFILAENGVTRQKIQKMFTQKEDRDRVNSILSKVNRSISRYITLKTIVSLITGVLSYSVLMVMGIDFAALWAVIIFALNYIPTIGSLIATIFPALMALVQFSALKPFLMVLFFIGLIQVVVGNFIEPKIMGNSLNISPLVVLLSLALGGLLWGVEGMVLCVPIAVIVIITLSHFEPTKKIAILLSEKGDI